MEININLAPTLHPTAKEFANYNEYMYNVEKKYAKQCGVVKIVPPKNWKAKKSGYQNDLETGMIPKPIEQNAYGKGGIYECLYMVQKSLSMKEYIKRGKKFEDITKGKSTEQIEQMFYKHLAFSPPLYGADSRNSLFEPGCLWNLGEMKTLLQDGLKDVIAGVNDPYLYVGVWKTTFAWHKEDLNLGAINFLHYGKPKFWYAIPEEDHHYLEKMSKLYFADNFNKCSEYLRHKTTIISPYLLKKKFPECRINKVVQNAGEFIMVFPGAYHHGFNYGFNIAEAVNYATKNWLPIYLKAGVCKCVPDQVKINHRQFYDNLIASNPGYKDDPEIKAFLKKIKELGLYDTDYSIKPKLQQSQQTKKKRGTKVNKAKNQQQEENIEEEPQKKLKTPRGAKKTQKIQQEQQQQKEKQQEVHKKQSPLPIKKKRIAKSENKSGIKQTQQSESDQDESINSNSSSTALSRESPIKKRASLKKQNNNNNDKNQPKKQMSKVEEINNNKKIAKNQKKIVSNKSKLLQEQQKQKNMIVEDWLQCDECKKWRKIDSTLKNLKRRKQFFCKSLGVKCDQPQVNNTYTLSVQ